MAIADKTAMVVGVFNSVQDAQEAVKHLENQGFSKDEVSLVYNRNSTGYDRLTDTDRTQLSDKTSDVIADAGIGAAIGGVGGILLSIAGFAVPGIGPILAAGPIAAALAGAGIGAAGGGLIGALTESGVPEEHANYYSEAVRRGDVLVTVRASGDRADRASQILDQHGAVDVDERVSNWRERGWQGRHDTTAEPYSPEDLNRERSFYGSTMAGATGYMNEHTHTARQMETEDTRVEDTGRGSSYDKTSEFESTRPGVGQGTWSRDTERGAGIGLGLDPLGREMRPDATSGLADDAGDFGRRVGDDMRDAGHDIGRGGRDWPNEAENATEHAGHRMKERAKSFGDRIEEGWDRMTGQSGKADVKEAGHRMEETGQRAADRIEEGTRRTGDNLRDAGYRSGEGAEHAGHRMKESAKSFGDRIEEGWDRMTGQSGKADVKEAGHRMEETGQRAGDRIEEGADRAWNDRPNRDWSADADASMHEAGHRTGEAAKSMGHRIEEGARKAGHRVEETWNEMTGKPGRGLDKAANRIDEGVDKAGNRVDEWSDRARDRMDESARRSRIYRG